MAAVARHSTPLHAQAVLLGDSIIRNPTAVKQKLNVSPQETAVAPNLTVRENLELVAQIYGIVPQHLLRHAARHRHPPGRSIPGTGL